MSVRRYPQEDPCIGNPPSNRRVRIEEEHNRRRGVGIGQTLHREFREGPRIRVAIPGQFKSIPIGTCLGGTT
ncbi:MAG: hypothetical protein QOG89_751, partial [Thermomicrobiales bacterium]|nr:hypothetical protein [Thermomicrobiales bacterium]